MNVDLAEQVFNRGGPCEICGRPGQVVDHCHKTRLIRGWLCRVCNLAIGKFDDDPLRLMKAAQYIHKKGLEENGIIPDEA